MSSSYQPPMPNAPPPYPGLQNPAQPAAPGWFRRNLAWLIPAVIVFFLLLIGAFVAGIFTLVSKMMTSSEPYKHGVQVALSDPRVQAKLGPPIKPGWLVSGNINTAGPSGNADLSVPLKGSIHNGTLYIVAKESADRWSYDTLEVAVEGEDKRLNLLPAVTIEEK